MKTAAKCLVGALAASRNGPVTYNMLLSLVQLSVFQQNSKLIKCIPNNVITFSYNITLHIKSMVSRQFRTAVKRRQKMERKKENAK